MPPLIHLVRFASRSELDEALANRIVSTCSEAGARSTAAIMLSGGSTPAVAYRLAASRPLLPRSDLHVLYCDERYVPIDSEDSNYRMSRVLLDRLALPDIQVLRVRTELPLEAAAADYDGRLAALATDGMGIGLALLGLGADGHTASLFSAADIERSAGRLAIAVHRPDGRDAVSVTPRLIGRSAQVLFVVAGADKRAALTALLRGDEQLPAWQVVAGCRRVELWADAAAHPQERVQL